MFRNRRTSQKPSDDLYKNFKADFPQLGAALPPSTSAPPAHAQPTSLLAEALDIPINPRSLDDSTTSQLHDHIKDADSTPRGSNEPWNFGTSGLTPSIMDPNNNPFNMFANQLPGYYTPTPGGTSTLYHNQAGDLHTPQGFGGMGLGTPLSMPTSESGLHAGQHGAQFHGFHPQMPQHLPPQHFQNVNPFQMHHHPQAFPPHQFTHQPSFDTMDGQVGDSPVDDLGMDLGPVSQQHHHSPEILFQPPNLQATMQPPPLHPQGEKFRYHVTLNAPTAMIKHSDEIPVTYLNKGQAYTLNVVDTSSQQSSPSRRYRTFVRVSFEDEQQRQKPASCWQLWKEGRGTNEAHHRGGRLQAVEYVESGQSGLGEDPTKPKVELESASFDGFCVLWSPSNGTAECPISVRFNFLSTDFSHSKGVKGIPVRLCAKTEAFDEAAIAPRQAIESEVCYCKVKLFRDHGAERKLSNDVAHVKKTIDKLNQQIAQLESGMRDLGKRKRSGSFARGTDSRPAKIPKHRRTWSMTSVGSNGGKGSAEEDLHIKLMNLQDMFTSTRPASILYLRGEEGDDPDAHPVKLTGDVADLVRNDSGQSAWDKQSQNGLNSSVQSPTPSSNNSLVGSRKDANMQQPTPVDGSSRVNSNEWKGTPRTALIDIQPAIPEQLQSPPDTIPTKVKSRSSEQGTVCGWIEALGVDHGYQPPPERPTKPIASFYIQPRVAGKQPEDNFFRAIYLMRRTLEDFNTAVAMKCGIEPSEVLRTFRITENGINILYDDECIRELPEGQDMIAECSELDPEDIPFKPKREWDVPSTDGQRDGELSTRYEVKLLF